MSKVCDSCKIVNDSTTIPYAAYESTMARVEKHIKRLVTIIVLLVLFLLCSNVAWIVYENQFSCCNEVEQEVYQEAANGCNNFVGGDYIGKANN